MNTFVPPQTAQIVSQAYALRLTELIAELRAAADPDAELLSGLLTTLPAFRAALPANARAAADALDANEQQLRAAHAEAVQLYTACTADLTAPLTSRLLLDSAALSTYAERAHRLAQAAAELALRARARATALEHA